MHYLMVIRFSISSISDKKGEGNVKLEWIIEILSKNNATNKNIHLIYNVDPK